MRIVSSVAVLALTSALLASQAQAVPISFDLTYSGNQFGNQATGFGSVTLDDAVLLNPGIFANVTAARLGITDFNITIANAASGNGTFGLSSVTNWILVVTRPLDLNSELVSQLGFLDFNWCGLNFIGCVSPAPGGVAAFTIRTNAETGDPLRLVSMKRVAAVSEPTPLSLMALALCGIGLARRRLS